MYKFVLTRAALPPDTAVQLYHKSRAEVAGSINQFPFNKKRLKVLSNTKEIGSNRNGVVYWMSRNQRIEDNWGLLYAQSLALRHSLPLHIVFCLADKFLDATFRHFKFMLDGLKEVHEDCANLNINFHLLRGQAGDQIPNFMELHKMTALVCDMSPLRIHRSWVENVKAHLPAGVPFVQVDGHNVVPVWETSDREEPTSSAVRKRIMPKLAEFLTEFPPVIRHPHESFIKPNPIDWNQALKSVEVDKSVGEVPGFKSGYKAAVLVLDSFIKQRLENFSKWRNNPVQQHLGASNLSPYFHFGQLSPQRAVLEVKKFQDQFKDCVDAFISGAVVTREMAENFCYYNSNYDNLNGAKDWAKTTLNDHLKDKREYIYKLQEFEDATTHDKMWNAAQREMKVTGKMAGYMRMYWAKKILEWTETPEEAIIIAIYLNDRYSLDGRDSNGYLGIMWSIAGVADRAFGDRSVIGKIRSMLNPECFQKFDTEAYIAKFCGNVNKKSKKM